MEAVARIGNPEDHRGGAVVKDGTRLYLEWNSEILQDGCFKVYRIRIDTDLLRQYDWVDASLIAKMMGCPVSMVSQAANGPLQMRANLAHAAASLYGWDLLDRNPLLLDSDEIIRRWERKAKFVVLPYSKDFNEAALKMLRSLQQHGFPVDVWTEGPIGERYKRADSFKIPSLTVDAQTVKDGTVVLRKNAQDLQRLLLPQALEFIQGLEQDPISEPPDPVIQDLSEKRTKTRSMGLGHTILSRMTKGLPQT